jgi:hypothetical protein
MFVGCYILGGLLFKSSGSNLQHATSYSFLLLVYAGYLNTVNKKIDCGGGVLASSRRLKQLARSQVGYICKIFRLYIKLMLS